MIVEDKNFPGKRMKLHKINEFDIEFRSRFRLYSTWVTTLIINAVNELKDVIFAIFSLPRL